MCLFHFYYSSHHFNYYLLLKHIFQIPLKFLNYTISSYHPEKNSEIVSFLIEIYNLAFTQEMKLKKPEKTRSSLFTRFSYQIASEKEFWFFSKFSYLQVTITQ